MGEAKRRGTLEDRVAQAKPATVHRQAQQMVRKAMTARVTEAVRAELNNTLMPAQYLTSVGRVFKRVKKIQEDQ